MGAIISRQNAAIEEVDIVSNHAYKYPPKSGNYFGNHFIMGGERFETPQPEAYLFGENGDLNFLGSRPTPFPYPPPQANEPTKTLKSLVNIRKESVRLVRVVGAGKGAEGDAPAKSAAFNIEFTFDCDARTAITIYYFATEEFTPNGVVYCPKDPSLTSDTYVYGRGTNQLFSQPTHVFEPSCYTDDELTYSADREVIPVAIHCVTAHEPGSDDQKQSHTSIAVVERHSDGTYVLKALKQRLYVDGLCYLLQEIYGIENKASDNCKASSDEETEDGGCECVICMCDVRDTLILPCRHLCLCNSCADSLRYQANNCPICRAPFRALLQIRALQKASSANANGQSHQENSDGIPPGFEAVSLIEALNGPSLCRSGGGGGVTAAQANLVVALEADDTAAAQLAAEALNRSTTADKQPECVPTSVKLPPEADVGCGGGGGEEVRMSVLLAREGSQEAAGKSKGRSRGGQGGDRTPRDTVRVINEIAPTQDEVCLWAAAMNRRTITRPKIRRRRSSVRCTATRIRVRGRAERGAAGWGAACPCRAPPFPPPATDPAATATAAEDPPACCSPHTTRPLLHRRRTLFFPLTSHRCRRSLLFF